MSILMYLLKQIMNYLLSSEEKNALKKLLLLPLIDAQNGIGWTVKNQPKLV